MKNNIYERPIMEFITLAAEDIITGSQLTDGNEWTEKEEGSTGFDKWGQ